MTSALRALGSAQVLRHWWRNLPSAALMNAAHRSIDVRYQSPADLGTLPHAAEICGTYFSMQDGDVVLTTDPYSGGSLLSNLTFVSRIVPSKASGCGPLSLVTQTALKPWFLLGADTAEEGLRIPPTPVVQGGEVNTAILAAIRAHPLAAADLDGAVERSLTLLRSHASSLKKYLDLRIIDLSDAGQKTAERLTREAYLRSVDSLASGVVQKVARLEDGARVRLTIDHADDRFLFDFSGTTESATYSMTSSAALGACIAAVLATSGRSLPVNAGLLDLIKIVTPRGTLVNAQFPKPVFRGMTDGVMTVANMGLNGICEMEGNTHLPVHGVSQCAFSIDFGGGKKFFDSLEPGTAAAKNGAGEDALNIWKRSRLKPSIEEIEKRFPLLIKSFALRARSGGSGAHTGGNGSTKVIELLEPARITWMTSQDATKPVGGQGGKTGHGPEVALVRRNERQELGESGTVDAAAGDVFVMHAPGGGGYGAPEPTTQQSRHNSPPH